MNKNILVITGSPRKQGNSALMAGALIKEPGRRAIPSKHLRPPSAVSPAVPPAGAAGAAGGPA